jgi:hypothetical protein
MKPFYGNFFPHLRPPISPAQPEYLSGGKPPLYVIY